MATPRSRSADDLTEAMVKIFRPGEFGRQRCCLITNREARHLFDESFKDCVFVDEQTLLGVGEAFGQHGENWDLDRSPSSRVLYELPEDTGKTQVMGGDLATQSFATAVDVNGAASIREASVVGSCPSTGSDGSCCEFPLATLGEEHESRHLDNDSR